MLSPSHSRAAMVFDLFLLGFILHLTFGVNNDPVERVELPDLNSLPPEHGSIEHPAIHKQNSIEKTTTRKQQNRRIGRDSKKNLNTEEIEQNTNLSDCDHSKTCKHWSSLPKVQKDTIRLRKWRAKLPDEVRREKGKMYSRRYRALRSEEAKQAQYEKDNKARRIKYNSLQGEEREAMLANLRAKFHKYKGNISKAKNRKSRLENIKKTQNQP